MEVGVLEEKNCLIFGRVHGVLHVYIHVMLGGPLGYSVGSILSPPWFLSWLGTPQTAICQSSMYSDVKGLIAKLWFLGISSYM